MKKLLLSLILIFLSSNAMAEWTYLGKSEKGDVYSDIERIEYVDTGSRVSIWILFNFKKAQLMNGYQSLSSKDLFEFDCKRNLFRIPFIEKYSTQMGKGEAFMKSNRVPSDESLEWLPIDVDNFMLSTIYTTLCSVKIARQNK